MDSPPYSRTLRQQRAPRDLQSCPQRAGQRAIPSCGRQPLMVDGTSHGAASSSPAGIRKSRCARRSCHRWRVWSLSQSTALTNPPEGRPRAHTARHLARDLHAKYHRIVCDLGGRARGYVAHHGLLSGRCRQATIQAGFCNLDRAAKYFGDQRLARHQAMRSCNA